MITLEPMTVEASGEAQASVAFVARLRHEGKPVAGARIVFYGIPGRVLGAATTDAEGIATLRTSVGPKSTLGFDADEWTGYRAQLDVNARGDRGQGCLPDDVDARFSYQP